MSKFKQQQLKKEVHDSHTDPDEPVTDATRRSIDKKEKILNSDPEEPATKLKSNYAKEHTKEKDMKGYQEKNPKNKTEARKKE